MHTACMLCFCCAFNKALGICITSHSVNKMTDLKKHISCMETLNRFMLYHSNWYLLMWRQQWKPLSHSSGSQPDGTEFPRSAAAWSLPSSASIWNHWCANSSEDRMYSKPDNWRVQGPCSADEKHLFTVQKTHIWMCFLLSLKKLTKIERLI